ncbi:MAG: TIGR00153 family protein [Gammaproteobacteria bacterium]|nr:MAG: TIGR00153 family protein [Gammaproteobacteria bacterium]
MPVGDFLSNIFGKSPIKPMQQHMEKVLSCVSELVPLFNAVIAENWEEVTRVQKQISTLEDEADDLKKQIRMQLPNGIFMPVSRRDLLEVLTMQDKIANTAKDVAGIILGRQMVLPKQIAADYVQFVQRCVDACAQANRTINELDELVETGFRGHEVMLVQSMIKELDAIEDDTDKLQVKIRHAVFKIEKELPPVDVIFLYKIIELTGDVADRAQRVGSRLQLLLAR